MIRLPAAKARSLAFPSLILIAIFLLMSCVSAPPPLPSLHEGEFAMAAHHLDAFIPSEMANRGITGLGIVVADSGGVIWSKGYGLRNKAKNLPFTSETVSNVGSVSKLFTCAAVLKLVEEGKIDLDAPLSAYIPNFGAESVTVRRVLDQHSGLPSDNLRLWQTGNERPPEYPYSYRALEKTKPYIQDPDIAFSYSNYGYSLLGILVEKASGEDFESYVQKALLRPLGMADTSFLLPEMQDDRYARGYLVGKETGIPYIRDIAAGALNSSPRDMGLFMSSMLASAAGGKGLLRPETVREAFRAQNEKVALDEDFRIGLTWWILSDSSFLPGETAVGHGGDLPPYHALLILDPSRDLGVTVLVNSAEGLGSFSLADIASRALRVFAQVKGQEPMLEPAPAPAAVPMPKGEAADLEGIYATQMGYIQIRGKGDTLQVFAFGNWLEGTRRSDGSIAIAAKIGPFELPIPVLKEITLTPARHKGEAAIALRAKGVFMGIGLKLGLNSPHPEWLARSGEYALSEPEKFPMFAAYRLGVDKETGLFCFSAQSEGSWSSFPLRTIDSGTAIIEGAGRNMGEMIKALPGTSEVEVMGLRLTKK